MNDVVLSQEDYEFLQSRSEFLGCLEAAGVDNWDGYCEARRMFNEEE